MNRQELKIWFLLIVSFLISIFLIYVGLRFVVRRFIMDEEIQKIEEIEMRIDATHT